MMRERTRFLTLAALALSLAGCSDGWLPAVVNGDSGTPPGVSTAPTYYQNVRPVLQAHCNSCHTAGGIAPMALDSADAARSYAEAIASATASHEMPPWPPGGASPAYLHERKLTAEELKTLADWNTGGAQEGDAAHPAADGIPDSPSLGTTDFTGDIGVDYVANKALTDDYRCFLVDLDASADHMVTGYVITPGNGKVVHHVITTLYAADQKAALVALDASDSGAHDGRAGWPCFGGAVPEDSGIVSSGWLGAWVPGMTAVALPAHTGVPITPGTVAVMQVHYNLAGGQDPDRTRISVKYAADADAAALAPLTTINIRQPLLDILANDANVAVSAERTAKQWTGGNYYPDGDAYLLTIFGHQHLLGKSIAVRVVHDDTGLTETALEIPAWDFHWQGSYTLVNPIKVKATDHLRIECNYDNTQEHRNEEGYLGPMAAVHWGEGTQDEMCISFLTFSDNLPAP